MEVASVASNVLLQCVRGNAHNDRLQIIHLDVGWAASMCLASAQVIATRLDLHTVCQRYEGHPASLKDGNPW